MSLAAPTSEVDICCLALDHLKQAPITTIDPPETQVEAHCARWYHQARREALRMHPWNFAIERAQLAVDATAPAFGYSARYLMPTDLVRYLGRYMDLGAQSISTEEYDIEGRYILLNSDDTINIRYITDFETISQMDPLFIGVFAINLAIYLSPKYAGSEARVTTLVALRKEMLANATAIDGQERPPRRIQRSKFIEARRGGRTGIAGPNTVFSG